MVETLGTPGTVLVTYLYEFSESVCFGTFRSCFVINFIINVVRKCTTCFGRVSRLVRSEVCVVNHCY